MPRVLIEIRREYTQEQEVALMDLLRKITKENWGIRGGQASCDVELGFKVEV